VISFRYHVVSIVSVLFALAVGVALGAGPLRGQPDSTRVDQVAADRQVRNDLSGQVETLRRTGAFDDAFATSVSPGLLRGSLRGHEVSVVVLPTAVTADVSALTRLVGVAGGRVGITLQVTDQMLDVTKKSLVDGLGSQLDGRAAGLRIPAAAGPYDRIGALLGRALGTVQPGGEPADSTSTTILAGLQTAGLTSGAGGPAAGAPARRGPAAGAAARRGDLVLFVTGAGRGAPDARKGAATIVTSLVRAVDGVTAGTVLAGPVTSAGVAGPVRAVRQAPAAARDVSTVDTLGTTAGQVVSVLALAEQAAGRTGHYGAVGAADGAVPRAVAAGSH
jgi:hypothetical protein